MPVSNCTDEDVGVEIDPPSDFPFQDLPLAILFSVGGVALVALAFLLRDPPSTDPCGGQALPFLLGAGVSLLVAGIATEIQNRRNRPLRQMLAPISQLSLQAGKPIIRAMTVHMQPLTFPPGANIKFCSADGTKDLAHVVVGSPVSTVTILEPTALAPQTVQTNGTVKMATLQFDKKQQTYAVELMT